jgi:hypothetical protein
MNGAAGIALRPAKHVLSPAEGARMVPMVALAMEPVSRVRPCGAHTGVRRRTMRRSLGGQ